MVSWYDFFSFLNFPTFLKIVIQSFQIWCFQKVVLSGLWHIHTKRSPLHSQEMLVSGQTRLPICSLCSLLPGLELDPPMDFPVFCGPEQMSPLPPQTFPDHSNLKAPFFTCVFTTSHVLGSVLVPFIWVTSFYFIY